MSTNTVVTTTTLSNGTYSLTGLGPGTYTVTPSRTGYTFTPASRVVTVGTANVNGVNFTATQTAAPQMEDPTGEKTAESKGEGAEANQALADGLATHMAATPPAGSAAGESQQNDEFGTAGQEGNPSVGVAPEGTILLTSASEETRRPEWAGAWRTYHPARGGGPGPNARDEEEEVYSPREAVMAYDAREAAIAGPASPAGAEATYYYWDHLGTVRMTAGGNPTAETVERHDYEPYGLEMGPAPNTSGNTHQFTGHERDALGGGTNAALDYMHFRYYSPTAGRFMKPDNGADQNPMNPQSWNLYSYVRGNPVNFNDPTGHVGKSDEDQALKAQAKEAQASKNQKATPKQMENLARLKQGAMGVLKIAVGVGVVATAAAAAPATVIGALVVASVTIGGVGTGVSGIVDVLGASTKTDVSKAQEGLEAVHNLGGLAATAASGGNLEAGKVASNVTDLTNLAMKPKEAARNAATLFDSLTTLTDTATLVSEHKPVASDHPDKAPE